MTKEGAMKERHCEYCVHSEMVHGLERVVLICSHRPGYRGLWVAVGGRDSCARFKKALPSSLFELRRDKRDDGVRCVPLSQGKFALVDAGDYAAVMKHSWYAQKSYARPTGYRIKSGMTDKEGGLAGSVSNTPSPLRGTPPSQGESLITWYAVRKDGGRTVRMHREIVAAAGEALRQGSGQVVDHINHDGLDNRRCNLRVCSHAENVRNQRGQRGQSSRYKGVSRDRRLGKWRAQIWHKGRHYYLGLFESEAAAAEVYNAKARELFGEFAYLNKVREENHA